MTMLADNGQEEIHPNLFSDFMKQIPICDYATISNNSYLALSHGEIENVIRNYFDGMKSWSSGKFFFIFILLF